MPTLGTALTPEQLHKGSCWTLSAAVQGYARSHGRGLATQACAGRGFPSSRQSASERVSSENGVD